MECSPKNVLLASLFLGLVSAALSVIFSSHMIDYMTGQSIIDLVLARNEESEKILELMFGLIACVVCATVYSALVWKWFDVKIKTTNSKALRSHLAERKF